MNTQPRLRPKVVLRAVLGVVCLAAVGLVILLRLAIGPQKPTREEAVAFLHSEFDVPELRTWADRQFELGLTNAVRDMEAPSTLKKYPDPKHDLPLVFSFAAASPGKVAQIGGRLSFAERDKWKEVLIYPTNSSVYHLDNTTFLVTNQIYVRITR